MSRFAASLTLRTVHSQKFRGVSYGKLEPFEHEIRRACITWGDFLQSKRSNPQQYKLFLYYPGYFTHFDAEGLPDNWNTWIHRAIERDLVFTESLQFIASYVKLGPIIFFGIIRDQTKIMGDNFLRCSDGYLKKEPADYPTEIWNLLLDRSRNNQKVFSMISEKQREKSDATFSRTQISSLTPTWPKSFGMITFNSAE